MISYVRGELKCRVPREFPHIQLAAVHVHAPTSSTFSRRALARGELPWIADSAQQRGCPATFEFESEKRLNSNFTFRREGDEEEIRLRVTFVDVSIQIFCQTHFFFFLKRGLVSIE